MLAARGMMVSRETVDCMVFCGCLFNLMDFRLPEIFAKRFFWMEAMRIAIRPCRRAADAPLCV